MSFDLELMPVWMPPSPPISDAENDLYLDPTFDLFYEREQMPESKLPSLIHELLPRSPVKMERENKPPATPGGLSSVDDAIDSVRRQSIQKTQRPQQPPLRSIEKGQQRSVDGSTNAALSASAANSNYSPKSLFDGGPTSKNRTDVRRPFTPPPAFKEDDQYEGPEWSIVEDYALLLAITEEQHMTYNLLTGGKFGHVPNWDYVAGFVNRITGHYRSPRQCSMRYQLAVLPREEGRLVAYDPVTKKARKVHLSTTEVVHMKRGRTTTTQQFEADGQKLLSGRTAQRFKAIRAAKLRRPLPMKRNIAHSSLVTLVGRIPQQQDLKLSEWGIRYSAVQQPQEHAEYREERQLERKKLQQESARLKQQADQQRQAEQAALEQQQQRQQQVQQRQSAIPPPPGSSFTTEQPTARAHAGMETTNTALVDHQQMTATSTVQPVQRQASMQRQVSTGMPYTVVVSTQDSVVASGGRLQPISTSGSYGQYPVVSRQLSQPIEQVGTTAYRQIAPQVGKSTRTPPSTPMPVNYVQQGTHQVYATARSSSGQQQIVQGGAHHSIQIEPSSSSGSGEQLQLVRPVVAQQAAGQRQTDIRPKVLQQRVNRVILTTTAPPTDQQRAYIVPQGQGMRAVQARSGQGYSVARKATLPAIKALAGGQQQSVATVMLQGGTRVPAGQLGQLQQVRAVP
uniref:Myb-like domain-containing protein n=1 Tax=Plectus sambesii TaxID=2011161 RepID=A0A914W3V7_9BILA